LYDNCSEELRTSFETSNNGYPILYRNGVGQYDENGNLLEKHIYQEGIFTTEIEVLYNDKSKLITYVLTRDVATNFIQILRFNTLTFF
jgi:YD repeat-containing protein